MANHYRNMRLLLDPRTVYPLMSCASGVGKSPRGAHDYLDAAVDWLSCTELYP